MWTLIGQGKYGKVHKRGTRIRKVTNSLDAAIEYRALKKLQSIKQIPQNPLLVKGRTLFMNAFKNHNKLITLDMYVPNSKSILIYENIIKLIKRLHRLKISHGDLHGGNILVNPRTGKVYFIDFGKAVIWGNLKSENEAFSKMYKVGPHDGVQTYGPERSRKNIHMLSILKNILKV
jgi:RIO-like serine/threonine protein kinase